ncbi:MAG: hypothetical protein AB1898_17330 [Acidobacteriota bacterium]
MASEPKNRSPNPSENVVSPKRHEIVAEIDRKLMEARRLFSLRDYAQCEALVRQVLDVDPHNGKAKALDDLVSIKLSKKKLYQKLVGPADVKPASLADSREKPTASGAPSRTSDSSPRSERRSKPSPQRPVSPTAETVTPRSPRPSPPPEPSPDTDTMRERTISALVELFKQKEKSLEDWRDPRFDARALEAREEPASQVVTDSEGPSTTKPVEPDRRSGVPPPDSSAGFLPGSLHELFELEEPPSEPVAASFESPEAAVLPSDSSKPEHVQPESSSLAPAPGQDESSTPGLVPSEVVEPPPIELAASAPTTVESPPIPEPEQPRSGLELLTPPTDYTTLVERKLEQRSEDLRHSELKTVSVARIKKFLYQEEYDLCAQELERIRDLFPHNQEIQSFVQNTSARLTQLQRMKKFEAQAKELMRLAVNYYQEGKLDEALIAAREVLRVIPHHSQAKELVDYVQKRLERERHKSMMTSVKSCRSCGLIVEPDSRFCCHCGQRIF